MITWLQVTFQKHNKWLFSLLLAIVILTFVLTIGNQSFFGSNAGPNYKKKDFFGYNLASQRDSQEIFGKGQISLYLNPKAGINNQMAERYSLMRIVALAIADQYLVPIPSTKEVEAYIRSNPAYQNEDGSFNVERYNQTVSALRNSNRYNESFLATTLREDYRIDKVLKILGGPGYIQDAEIRDIYQTEQTDWTIKIATLSYKDFNPKITPKDEELKAYYNENPNRYEVAEQIHLQAVIFDPESYLLSVTDPSQEQKEQYFKLNKFRYQKAPKEGEEAQEVSLAEVETQVISDWKKDEAKKLAAHAAEEFTYSLWKQKIAMDSEAFTQLIESNQGNLKTLPDYSRGGIVPVPGVNPQKFKKAIEAFDGGRYFSDLIETRDQVIVLIKKGYAPSYIPSFEEAKKEVILAYKEEQRKKAFIDLGELTKTRIQASLAEGKTFAEAAEALKLKVESFPPFNAQSVPWQLRRSIFPKIQDMNKGDLSPMLLNSSNGQLVYIEDKAIQNASEENELFAKRKNELKTFFSEQSAIQWLLSLVENRMAAYE